jgi:3-phenylpropionate/cinnamic acid dioxygenase small subunit
MDDRGHVENLMVLYTEAIDDARFDALGELFANATVTIEGGPQDGSEASGRSETAALYRRIVALGPTGLTGTRHFITNVFVLVDGADATARSYFAVTQQTSDLPLQIVACGAYRDTYRRSGDQWAFASRHIVCDQVGNLSQHMK